MKFFKLLLVITIFLSSYSVFAQPSDATVKAKALSNGSTFVEFVGDGRIERSLTETWYTRVVVTKKATEVAGVNRISGIEYTYNKYGSSWKFSKTNGWYIEYEGLPNPTEAEAVAFVKADLKTFLTGAYRDVVGEVESITLAEDPKWQWELMTTVRFNMAAIFKRKVNSTTLSKVKQEFKVTFSSDEVKGPWKSFRSMNSGSRETISSETFTAEELRAMPTLSDGLYFSDVQASFDKLPKVDIPDFKSVKEVIFHTHKMLRELSKDEMNYYLVKTITPRHFHEGSDIALNDQGRSLIEDALEQAYRKNTSYAKQFCEFPLIKHEQDNMMQLWNKEKSRNCRISVHKIGDAYKINALSFYVLSKMEDYTRIEAANKCGEPYVEKVVKTFGIGDAIKTKDRGAWKEGKISKKDNVFDDRYYVTFNGGGGAWVNADQMEKSSGGATKTASSDKTTTSESKAKKPFKVGDKIMGNWKNKGKYYSGTISAKLGNKYVIFYDDGDKETCTADQLKHK